MEDVGPVVVASRHSPEALERVEATLDFVSPFVDSAVEAGRPPAVATAPLAVDLLVLRLGEGVLDLASPQVAAVSARAVRLIATDVVRSRPRVTDSRARYSNAIHSRCGSRRRRPAKLHGDKGYDYRHLRRWLASGGIRHRLARKGIELSRRLGRHCWVVERTVSWLSGCRRLHRRYERKPEHFLAFTAIAATLICHRRLAE